MDFTAILGWAAAVVSVIVGLPQFLRLRRTRNTAGISVVLWQLGFCITLIWTAHGIIIGSVSQIAANIACTLVNLSVLALLHTTRGIPWLTLLGPGLAGAAILIAVDLGIGSAAFGFGAIIPSLLGNSSQSLKLLRSRSVAGVSLAYLVLYNVNQCLWTSWGHLVHDSGTFIASLATWVIVLFNLIWWGLRRLGLHAVAPLPAEPLPAT
jgi:uncharacterized protein with PQ loop repeat